MSNRDEFSTPVKRALAERAGYRCSFTGCDVVTVGPSTEGDASVSKTGMACHIAAAAGGRGARRYVKEMSSEERTAIDNGIWMCGTHGTLIDNDERRFTIPMLKKWREFAESRANFRHEMGSDTPLPQDKLIEVGFANATIFFEALGNETEVIGNLLLDSCVPLVWGESLCYAVRDVLIEIVRNTFQHGSASTCKVDIDKCAILITDDGIDFNWLGLASSENGRGGAASVKNLVASFRDKLILGSKRFENQNYTTISLANSIDDLSLVAPCSIRVTKDQMQKIYDGELPAAWFSSETNNCRIIYILLPRFLPYSDAMRIAEILMPEMIKDKQIVFVASHASGGVQSFLLNRFPDARVLNISE